MDSCLATLELLSQSRKDISENLAWLPCACRPSVHLPGRPAHSVAFGPAARGLAGARAPGSSCVALGPRLCPGPRLGSVPGPGAALGGARGPALGPAASGLAAKALAPMCSYKQALVLIELGNEAKAIKVLEKLSNDFPNSTYAANATGLATSLAK